MTDIVTHNDRIATIGMDLGVSLSGLLGHRQIIEICGNCRLLKTESALSLYLRTRTLGLSQEGLCK
jgi:hypothetical protein